ncbi:dienelactone hydrolase family protein [Gulbenkiania mobilis]|uniref:dienelactone hydrolase family protein n=1 Tax=Gulbenkiania mobilis TaxID=397457 RepID=UPI0009F89B5D|nr:dienelactone hydrolase family protein [Gulbenkiania mobilis]
MTIDKDNQTLPTERTQASAHNDGRRAFLSFTLASGFAMAVQPVMAGAITTDGTGLLTSTVAIPVSSGMLPAYQARPAEAKGLLPVVLVVQEVFGVHEHIQDLCRRLAKSGYLAIAPELYFRQGDPRAYKAIGDLVSKLVSRVPDQQVMADLDATLAWASANGGDSERAAVTGFCWGGRIVWLYADHNPRLKAGVTWYGKLAAERTENTPIQPVDVATRLKVPVLGLYGGEDASIPHDTIEAMRAALLNAPARSEIRVYPDAGHGFNADYRPSYNAPAATDGWARMLEWFTHHGVR